MRRVTFAAIALRLKHAPTGEIIDQRRGQKMQRSFVLGDIDVLSRSSAPAVIQRGQQHRNGKPRRNEIGIGAVGRRRIAAGVA
jgi:hypothetical protein